MLDIDDLQLYVYISLIPVLVALAIILVLRLYYRQVVQCKCEHRLDGKTVIITGGNCGLGHVVSIDLAKRGAKVILACRDRGRRDSAPFSVRSRSGNVNVRFMYLDLSSLDSIVEFCHQFCESESRLDILINNAAVLCPRDWTMDGFDQMMGVNYLGHFLLTNLLHEKLQSTGSSPKVINMVCDSYRLGQLDAAQPDFLPFKENEYDMYKAYGCSKLAQLIITKEMSDRFRKDGISVFAVNPGNINTKILRNWPGKLGKARRALASLLYMNAEDGAQSIIYCAVSRDLETDSGKCVALCKASEPAVFSQRQTLRGERLWEKTESLLKTKGFDLVLKYDEE